VELEHVRQPTWFYSRSSEATVNNVSSATARIYNLQEAMGVPIVPPVWSPSAHSPLADGWYMAHGTSKVKAQSLISGSSAFNQLCAMCCGRLEQPMHSIGTRSSDRLRQLQVGAVARVLGEEKIATARLAPDECGACVPESLLGAGAHDCFLRGSVYTMAFLRPGDLSKCTSYGMWVHYFAHMKARALRLPRWYLGIAFGEQVVTARGRRTIGAMARVSRRGQQFDADGRGSDVVIVARSESGLVPGRIPGAILLLRVARSAGRICGLALIARISSANLDALPEITLTHPPDTFCAVYGRA
jgi:hypothetical protein